MKEFVAKYKTVPCDEETLKRHGWKRFVLKSRINKKKYKIGGLIMTDEQIKQNAEEWVKPLIGEEDGKYNKNDVSLSLMKNAFIAGAHSRDEEIERIKNEAVAIMDEACALKIELNKLRNPWISVEERLPDEPFSVGSNRSKEVYVRTAKGCDYIASYNFNRKDWIIVKDGYVELTNDNVIKWMPIPN